MPIWIINSITMLFYDRIDVFEGNDVSETRKSKEWNVCGIF